MELVGIMKNGTHVLRMRNGAFVHINDEGFTVKGIPNRGKEVKTTEWVDWLLVNDTFKAFKDNTLTELEAWLTFQDLVDHVYDGDSKRNRE